MNESMTNLYSILVDDNVVKAGVLRRGKQGKSCFCVLRQDSYNSLARFECYDTFTRFSRLSGRCPPRPKESITMKSIFSINKMPISKSLEFGIVLFTFDRTIYICCKDESDQQAWFYTLRSVYRNSRAGTKNETEAEVFDYVYDVKLLRRGLALSRPEFHVSNQENGSSARYAGWYRFCLNNCSLVLCKKPCSLDDPGLEFPLICISNFCLTRSKVLMIRLGRSAITGSGELFFDNEDAFVLADINRLLSEVNRENAEKRRTNPALLPEKIRTTSNQYIEYFPAARPTAIGSRSLQSQHCLKVVENPGNYVVSDAERVSAKSDYVEPSDGTKSEQSTSTPGSESMVNRYKSGAKRLSLGTNSCGELGRIDEYAAMEPADLPDTSVETLKTRWKLDEVRPCIRADQVDTPSVPSTVGNSGAVELSRTGSNSSIPVPTASIDQIVTLTDANAEEDLHSVGSSSNSINRKFSSFLNKISNAWPTPGDLRRRAHSFGSWSKRVRKQHGHMKQCPSNPNTYIDDSFRSRCGSTESKGSISSRRSIDNGQISRRRQTAGATVSLANHHNRGSQSHSSSVSDDFVEMVFSRHRGGSLMTSLSSARSSSSSRDFLSGRRQPPPPFSGTPPSEKFIEAALRGAHKLPSGIEVESAAADRLDYVPMCRSPPKISNSTVDYIPMQKSDLALCQRMNDRLFDDYVLMHKENECQSQTFLVQADVHSKLMEQSVNSKSIFAAHNVTPVA